MKNYKDSRIVRFDLAGESIMFLTTDPIDSHYNLYFEEYGANLSKAPIKKCNACDSTFVTFKHFDKCPICGCYKIEE